MFIVVTNIVDESVKFSEIIPKTIQDFNKNKIFFTEIEASSETQKGKVLIRHMTTEEFKKEFKANQELTSYYYKESLKISRMLKKAS